MPPPNQASAGGNTRRREWLFTNRSLHFAENSQRLPRASAKAVVSYRIVGSFAASMRLPLMINVMSKVPGVVWLALCRPNT